MVGRSFEAQAPKLGGNIDVDVDDAQRDTVVLSERGETVAVLTFAQARELRVRLDSVLQTRKGKPHGTDKPS